MIGSKIRQIRLNRAMTLSDLAAKTQTTPGYISQLERDIVDPSLSTLRKVAAALGVPIFTFLNDLEKQSVVVHENNRQKMELPDTNVVYEFLTPMGMNQTQGSKFVLLYYKLDPGCWSSEDSVSHNAEECVFALKGSLEVLAGGKVYHINEGDSIFIHENTPHKIYNPGKSKAIGISSIAPAIFTSVVHP